MAITCLIYGGSGVGKSRSMKNFDKDELALVNVINKPLPFKGKFTSTLSTDDVPKIVKAINDTQKKAIVIDDAGYIITNYFMKNHASVGGGNAVFSLYNELGDRFWTLLNVCNNRISDDKIVYIIMHEEGNDFGQIKPKTIGKLLDEKVSLEGMCTIVLQAKVTDDGKHIFITQNDGHNVAKSPEHLFDDAVIPNDLKAVDTAIRSYYELPPLGSKEKDEKKA